MLTTSKEMLQQAAANGYAAVSYTHLDVYKRQGMRRCFLAEENISEGLAVEQIEIIKVSSIGSLVELLNCPEQIKTSIRETEAIEELSLIHI